MGKLIIVSGPSAAGKTTLMERLHIPVLITVATRQPREGEIDGVHYRFITEEKFDQMWDTGEMCERTVYAGYKYGIFKSDVDAIPKDKIAYVILDFNGVKQMRELYSGEIITVFIKVDIETLIGRMKNRGDTGEVLTKRTEKALEQLLEAVEYDYIIDNSNGLLEANVKLLEGMLRGWSTT